ncbi:MAG: FHA domain-containing protein, partial [Planctomycetota bacterium]|nr:FHA domain-containing protein [Planctomycetota bacterium]
MFNLRLRQAETAFAEGRLNEAARLVEQPGVRDHREGQLLLTKIVAAFVERGREHLSSGRLDEAGSDCGEAKKLGGDQSAVAGLADEIASARRLLHNKAVRTQQVAAEAGREIARGDLDLGEKLLSRLESGSSSGNSVAGRMNDQLAVSRERVESATARARREVEAGHTRESVVAILELQKLSPSHPELIDLIDQVTSPVVSQLWFEVEAARLDRVQSLIESVRPLIDFDPELTEVCRAIESAARINLLLDASRFDEAYLQIRKLAPLLGNVAWLNELGDQAKQAAELAVEIKSSPLSLLNSSSRRVSNVNADLSKVGHRELLNPPPGSRFESSTLPEQLILQIDGVGSALLLRRPKISIGAAGRAGACDVALTGFPGSGELTIERTAGHYRLWSGNADDLAVNERRCQEKLLADGDSIRVGKRCRFRFRCPTVDVPSAVLELNGTRLARPDIRSIVLFDETLVVGSGQSSHLVARNLDQPL